MQVVLSRDCAANTSSRGHTILDFCTFCSTFWCEGWSLDLVDLREDILEPRSRQSLISLRICSQKKMCCCVGVKINTSDHVRRNRFHSFSKIRSVFFLNIFVYTWRTCRRLRHRRPIDPDVPVREKQGKRTCKRVREIDTYALLKSSCHFSAFTT